MLFFIGVPQRLNGKVYGELNGYSFENHDMHVYIVTSDGRAYTAISRINPEVEGNLRSLVSIGGIMGWLFAQPQHPDAKNGYMLSGILSVRLRQLTICPCLPIYSPCLSVYSDNACNTDDSAMSLFVSLQVEFSIVQPSSRTRQGSRFRSSRSSLDTTLKVT